MSASSSMYRAFEYFEPLSSVGRAAMVALSTFGWLFTTKAPSAPPRMAMSSVGKAWMITEMLPPWMMYAPKMHPRATA